MKRWIVKIIALLITFVLPFGANMLPYKLSDYVVSKGEIGKKILSCMMCFGGGVFFATYMLHMGPEVRYILDEALLKPKNISYPLAELIMAIGFFLVFIMEKITLKTNKRRQASKLKLRQDNCTRINTFNVKNTNEGCKDGECGCGKSSGPVSVDIEDLAARYADECPLSGTGECCGDDAEIKGQLKVKDDDLMVYQPEPEPAINPHATRSVVLIVALSLHRIFEGMSLGLQASSSLVWNLLIAVLCHELVIGFSMGLQFVKNDFSLKKMFVVSLICSLIMPIGVGIGTIVVECGNDGNSLNIINGVLQGVACGTFIYVTFFEILQEEIDAHDTSIGKLLSVMIGFGVMALLSLVPEHSGSPTSGVELVFNTSTYTTMASTTMA